MFGVVQVSVTDNGCPAQDVVFPAITGGEIINGTTVTLTGTAVLMQLFVRQDAEYVTTPTALVETGMLPVPLLPLPVQTTVPLQAETLVSTSVPFCTTVRLMGNEGGNGTG